MTKRKPSPAQTAELRTDRCPNCGGALKFPEHWKEGLCATCGIFVEILPSTPEPAPAKETAVPDVASRRVMAKFYLASEDLLSEPEEGETPAEAKEAEETPPTAEPEVALAAPKLEAPAPPKALPPGPTEGRQPEALSAPSETVGKETLQVQPQPRKQTQPAPAPPPLPKSPVEPRVPAPPKPLSPRETPPEQPLPETPSPDSEDYEIVVPEPTDEEPAPVEAETVLEQEAEVVLEPAVETEPAWEQAEPASELVEPAPVVPVAPMAVPIARTQAAAASRTATLKPRRRDRVLIHIGSVLVAFGGSGLILGSLLHDMFRIPLVGSAYNVFGPVNMAALMYGGVLLIVGLAAIGLSLRGGVVKVRKAVRA